MVLDNRMKVLVVYVEQKELDHSFLLQYSGHGKLVSSFFKYLEGFIAVSNVK